MLSIPSWIYPGSIASPDLSLVVTTVEPSTEPSKKRASFPMSMPPAEKPTAAISSGLYPYSLERLLAMRIALARSSVDSSIEYGRTL